MVVTYKSHLPVRAPRKLSAKQNLRDDIRHMLMQGKTVNEIAEDLGRSTTCIYSQLDRMGIKIKKK